MIRQLLLLLFLGVNAIYDILFRNIVLGTIPVFLIIGIVLCIFGEEKNVMVFLAFLPGALLLLTGRFTKEAIGYGDGLVVLVLGIYLGIWETCEVVLGALGISGLYSTVLLAGKKKGLHQEFPWIPCLLIAYVGRLVMECLAGN